MRSTTNILMVLLALIGFASEDAQAREPIAITAPDAPKAVGPYVQAVLVGDTMYLSGQLPIDPATGKLVAGDIRAQTQRVLQNLQAVLAANKMSLDDAVMANVYLTNLADAAVMNEVYGSFFKQPPARATVEVKGLALGALIEISLIAERRGR